VRVRGIGRAQLAATLLLMVGTLNIIYGIGGSLGTIGALLSIGGNYPWWSLAIFFLCIYIVRGIFIYGDDERAVRT
jgi:hypothetical protein